LPGGTLRLLPSHWVSHWVVGAPKPPPVAPGSARNTRSHDSPSHPACPVPTRSRQEAAASALCERGSGARRRRALRGPWFCSNPRQNEMEVVLWVEQRLCTVLAAVKNKRKDERTNAKTSDSIELERRNKRHGAPGGTGHLVACPLAGGASSWLGWVMARRRACRGGRA
jgi:hypothetical protein